MQGIYAEPLSQPSADDMPLAVSKLSGSRFSTCQSKGAPYVPYPDTLAPLSGIRAGKGTHLPVRHPARLLAAIPAGLWLTKVLNNQRNTGS